jgi:tRNA dimethylallyltransferase
MLRKGLADEVRRLVEMGYDKGGTAMQGIGYKEVLGYLRGEATLEETTEILKQNTRHYAKRQLTWFRRIEGLQWLDIDDKTDFRQLAQKIIRECIASDGIFL